MMRWLDGRIDSTCYVSWRAGKESMVVAHAARVVRPQIPVLMVDPGVPIHWTDEDRARMLAWMPDAVLFPFDKFAMPTITRAASEAAYRDAVHALMFFDLRAYADS